MTAELLHKKFALGLVALFLASSPAFSDVNVPPGGSPDGEVTLGDDAGSSSVSIDLIGDLNLPRLELSPVADATGTVAFRITADNDWVMTAKDDDPSTAGRMTEYSEASGYGARKLVNPAVMWAGDNWENGMDRSVVLTEEGTIAAGGPTVDPDTGEMEPQDVAVTFSQTVGYGDLPLSPGHEYRLVATLEVSLV